MIQRWERSLAIRLWERPLAAMLASRARSYLVALLAVSPVFADDDDEARRRMAWMSAYQVELFERSGSLVDDPEVVGYLQSVVDGLFPDLPELRVHVYRSTSLNAFVLPDGNIYFNTGMLARLEDEAQMAAILGHEGVHFEAEHSLRRRSNLQGTAMVTSVLGMATGEFMLSSLLAISSMSGYSRDMERESDVGGHGRMLEAGYDTRRATDAFERFEAETDLISYYVPFFFSSHPDMEERVATFRQLTADDPDGITLRDQYLAITGELRLEAFRLMLEKEELSSVIYLLGEDDLLATLPREAMLILADGYRRRGREGDLGNAASVLAAYRQRAPDDPGGPRIAADIAARLAVAAGDHDTAVREAERYLELGGEDPWMVLLARGGS